MKTAFNYLALFWSFHLRKDTVKQEIIQKATGGIKENEEASFYTSRA